MRIKKIFMRLLLMAEMVALGYLYFFGTNGIEVLQKQRVAVVNLEKNVVELKSEIEKLEQEIYAWQTDDFYKEKVAREQLQMARKGDELFYIGA
jgi:cell division protein FtsB